MIDWSSESTRRKVLRATGGSVLTGGLLAAATQTAAAATVDVTATCTGDTPGSRGVVTVTVQNPDTKTNYFVDLYGGTFNQGDTDATLRTNTATDSLSTRIENLDTSGCTESYTVEVYTKQGPTRTTLATETITTADFACELDDSAVYVSQEGCTLTLASRTSDTETVVLQSTNPQGKIQQHTISVPGCGNTTFQLNPKRGQYTLVGSATTAPIEGVEPPYFC